MIDIADFDYDLPEERIAKFPSQERDSSKLLIWNGGSGRGSAICETIFKNIGDFLPPDATLVFNDTRVVRARLAMFRPSGARVEVFCLEPHDPADYERAFAARGTCEWVCMVGNAKRWKSGPVECDGLRAWRIGEDVVRFDWDDDLTFGEKLERLGRVPIPPYLGRQTEEVDHVRYQTTYATVEGSVAAPTAGLHFTPEIISCLSSKVPELCADRSGERGDSTNSTAPSEARGGVQGECFSRQTTIEKITLHVGAGTFLPVKSANALEHRMHAEHFEVSLSALERLAERLRAGSPIVAVGTTSVRTLESLAILGWKLRNYELRVTSYESSENKRQITQFEWQDVPDDFDGYDGLMSLVNYLKTNNLSSIKASTAIMITPGFRFRVVGGLVTNFHQPRSTLLLLVSAFTGGRWREIYDYALRNDFRFLSYGDSSLLLP